MTSIKDAKEKFDDQINKISESELNVKLSFIKKTRNKKPEEKLYPNAVRLKISMRNRIRNVLSSDVIELWSHISSGEVKLRRFDLDDFTENDYGFIENGKLAVLDALVEKINMANDGTYIETLDGMGDAKAFCVELHDNDTNTNIIVFSSIKYSTIKKDEDTAGRMIDNKLEKIDQDIIVFTDSVYAMYIVDAKLFLVFNKKSTEKIFALNEFYQESSINILTELSPELIDTSEEFLKKNLTSKKIQEDIVKMNMNGQFDKTIENYRKYKELFEQHKEQLDEKLTQVDITDDNKLKIDTKEKLETFVHMSKHDILQDPLNTVELYIVYGKRSMRK